jgi:hypothetical protein
MDLSGVSGLTAQLSDYLTQLQENQQEQLAVNTDAASTLASTVQSDSVSISSEAYARSQNMLARNFVGANTGDSTYIDAQMTVLSTQQSLQNSMNDALGSTLESVIGQAAFWYGDERMRNAKLMKDTTEAHQDVMAEMTDNIEEQAAEAMAPKDENGEPIEQSATSAASGAPVEQAAASTSTGNAATGATSAQDVSVDLDGVAQAAEALASISIKV